MTSWNEYKEKIKNEDKYGYELITEIEKASDIVATIIDRRHSLGISQKELALRCHVPQSTIGRIETYKISPKIETLIKIFNNLGLKLVIEVQD